MKKISIAFGKKIQPNLIKWSNGDVLKRAMEFPFDFIRNLTGGTNAIDKNLLENYLDPEGKDRYILLEVFRVSSRMTVFLDEWMNQIFVTIQLFQPNQKEPSFLFTVIFSEHRKNPEYQGMKRPQKL